MDIKEIEKYVGKVVKIQLNNYGADVECVGSIVETYNGVGVTIGHPVINNESCCGKSYRMANDIISINNISESEFENWKQKYHQFHREIIAEKGYDSCEEKVESYAI